MSGPKHVPAEGGQSFGHNPFDGLSKEELPLAPESSPMESALRTEAKPARKNRGRVDIIRQKAGRGGKRVQL